MNLLRKHFSARFVQLAVAGTVAMALAAVPAAASQVWNWNYSASGIAANGTFTTTDSPNVNGGYLITGITGTRNGETITGLQAAGTPIPGNEPYGVDDLIFRGPGPQLTGNGFGFSTSGGNYSSPFYADFLPVPGYLEFFSRPPFTFGSPGPEDSELSVRFSATPVPEPTSFSLIFSALVLAGARRRLAGKSLMQSRTLGRGDSPGYDA